MAPTYGWQSQLGIDTVNPITQRFDFDDEELVLDEEFVDENGLRGTLARSGERVQQGIRRVHGTIRMQPTAQELTLLLPWILWGTPSGSGTVTYPLADWSASNTNISRYVTIDRGSKVFTMNGVVVNKATFHAAQNEPLNVDLELVGIDETPASGGTFPSLNLDVTKQPLNFWGLGITVGGTTVMCPSFQLTIDHALDTERFFNNQTVTALPSTDRHVTIAHDLPFGDYSAEYGLGVGGATEVLTFSNGVSTLTMTLNCVKYPRKSPRVRGRNEILFPLQGTAYKTGQSTPTLELVTVLTP